MRRPGGLHAEPAAVLVGAGALCLHTEGRQCHWPEVTDGPFGVPCGCRIHDTDDRRRQGESAPPESSEPRPGRIRFGDVVAPRSLAVEIVTRAGAGRGGALGRRRRSPMHDTHDIAVAVGDVVGVAPQVDAGQGLREAGIDLPPRGCAEMSAVRGQVRREGCRLRCRIRRWFPDTSTTGVAAAVTGAGTPRRVARPGGTSHQRRTSPPPAGHPCRPSRSDTP